MARRAGGETRMHGRFEDETPLEMYEHWHETSRHHYRRTRHVRVDRTTFRHVRPFSTEPNKPMIALEEES